MIIEIASQFIGGIVTSVTGLFAGYRITVGLQKRKRLRRYKVLLNCLIDDFDIIEGASIFSKYQSSLPEVRRASIGVMDDVAPVNRGRFNSAWRAYCKLNEKDLGAKYGATMETVESGSHMTPNYSDARSALRLGISRIIEHAY